MSRELIKKAQQTNIPHSQLCDQLSHRATGVVFNIQRYCIHDGPGIRTTVFLKGCGLSCCWCANPESISKVPELGFAASLCDGCGRCVSVCSQGALTLQENTKLYLQRERCTHCGLCPPVCSREALTIYGREMSVGEVLEEVLKDKMFYRGSGGGVTISGGEPLLQYRFVTALFHLCRQAGISTAMETAWYYSPQILRRVLPLTDVVFFDIKHMDPTEHERFTGKSNGLVLQNARLAASSNVQLFFRMPLIPNVNDTPENIQATSSFLHSFGDKANRIELLPFHRLGVGKGEAVGYPNQMKGIEPPDRARVERVQAAFEKLGTVCSVSGMAPEDNRETGEQESSARPLDGCGCGASG